jgi:hypothetical protein
MIKQAIATIRFVMRLTGFPIDMYGANTVQIAMQHLCGNQEKHHLILLRHKESSTGQLWQICHSRSP